MYKCAILGCGGRAKGHISAYQHVKRGKLVAICDMNDELLNKMGDQFSIKTRYTDFEKMLKMEQPDLLHIVTSPVLWETNQLLRYPLMRIASDYGVPAAIVEKPIAVMGEDWRNLCGLSAKTKTKFVVNTQLNFHPQNLVLKQDVADGKIGDIKFIEASARQTPVDQGPHVLQLISSYIDNVRPVRVMGQVSGRNHMNSAQPSPDHASGLITYANGLQASVAFGTEMAPSVIEGTSNDRHKRICIFGSKGFIHWRYESWEQFTADGGYQGGNLDYGDQDIYAQAGLTEAVFDWLEDESRIHPTHLDQSLAEFNLLLSLYYSSLIRQPLDLPVDLPDNFFNQLREVL